MEYSIEYSKKRKTAKILKILEYGIFHWIFLKYYNHIYIYIYIYISDGGVKFYQGSNSRGNICQINEIFLYIILDFF